MAPNSATETLDLAAFERWLRARPGFELAAATGAAPVAGGVSNLTYRVSLRDSPLAAVAARLERKRGIFEPYDVIREGRIVAALAATDVPVPTVLGCEEDPGMLGARFIVLGWIDAPHMGEAGPEADFGAFVAMVRAIHQVDWRAHLSFLGVPGDAAAASLAELDDIAARLESFAPGEGALLDGLASLRTTVPGGGALSFCHGDINVFNYLFRAGEVVGVVDWERARIGDLRSDLGQLLALSNLKGQPWGPADAAPFASAYSAVAGEPVAGLAWFRARWLLDLAVIERAAAALGHENLWFSRAEVLALLERALAEVG